MPEKILTFKELVINELTNNVTPDVWFTPGVISEQIMPKKPEGCPEYNLRIRVAQILNELHNKGFLEKQAQSRYRPYYMMKKNSKLLVGKEIVNG